ncbi:MAG: GNAT family N-acetyltransferase [Clostridia bacterium]|nr:GNAT family N-acetyltransferase [Clostridia bacterium]
MEIRHIKESDDKKEISKIYEDSWKFAYAEIIPKDYLDNIPAGSWIPHLENKNMNNLVLIKDGKFIGTSSYCRSRSKEFKNFGEIVSIYLLPEYVGKSYGKKLFKATLNELTELGYKDVFLWVLEENVRARRFYESQKFKLSDKFNYINIGGKNLKEVAYTFRIG